MPNSSRGFQRNYRVVPTPTVNMNQNRIPQLIGFIAASLLCVVVCSTSLAQSKSERTQKTTRATMDFLFRLDRNNNNRIDPNEMVGASKNYLRKLGLDTRNGVNLADVAEKLESKNEQQKAKAAGKANNGGYVQKVPGFGGTRSQEKEERKTSGFGGGGQSSAIDMDAKYGDRVMRLVNRTIESYDANENGSLDPSEIKRARWGKPTPQESDRNHDGILTKIELAERYLAREKDAGRAPDSSSSRSKKRVSPQPPRQSSTRRSSKSNSQSSRSSSRSSKRPSTSQSKSELSKSTSDRYERYADGLMTSYDSNKDGRLDSKELGKMRRPPKNADANGDSFVTKQELIDAVSGNSKPSPVRSTTADPQAQQAANRAPSRSSRSSRTSRSSRKRPTRTSSSFQELDKNEDNQISMGEFAEDWDGELVAQFQAKDLNGDGLITADEWNGR